MLNKKEHKPDVQGEIEELQRVVQYLNRDEGVDITVHDLVKAFQKSKETTLTDEVWAQLENTESNEIEKGDFDAVMDIAKKYDKSNPKKLAEKLKSGDYKRPLIVKFGNRYHLVSGNTRLSTAASLGLHPKVFIASIEVSDDLQEKWSEKYKKSIDCSNPKGFSQRAHCQGRKKDATESMGADAAGAFSAAFNTTPIKRKITTIHNLKEQSEIDEAMTADASGPYDVPFPSKKRKDPLSIGGPDSIKKSRAVKDKKFPKYGGPEGVYVKIKEKCKKFPYCNQGDINALEILKEDNIEEVIQKVSKKTGIPKTEIQNIVINEINKIFIKEYGN